MSTERERRDYSIAAIRESDRQETLKINRLVREKGFKRLSDEFLGVWVSESEETSKIPSRFFTVTHNEEGEVLFKEHSISFPIEDPAQLLTSLNGFNALFEAHEGAVSYTRNDPTSFVEFIGSFVGGKQSEAKS